MTLCCQCSGVTPPPPPNPGACCSKVLGEIYTQCNDDVEYSDCLVREMGIHHPDKTCAQLRVDNGYPSQRTDWPEPACDLLGSCCFYFIPSVGDVNRVCQNAVPSGTCKVDERIGGRQSQVFHYYSHTGANCPNTFDAKSHADDCSTGPSDDNCNCKVCESGPQKDKDECSALNFYGPVTIVQDYGGGPDNGYPVFNSGVPCSCNGIEASAPLYQDACCPPPSCPDDEYPCIPTCFVEGSRVLMSDGSYKTIENVEIGDEVQSLEASNKVLDLERTTLGGRKLISINGSKFFVSYDHPIYTLDGFKSVNSKLSEELYPHIEFNGDLSIGDTILSPAGEVAIQNLEVQDDYPSTPLYDLKLDGNHIYFVEDIAVHNCVCVVQTCCYNEGEHCFSALDGGPVAVASEGCNNKQCCSDEGGPLSCPDYPNLPNFTCDQLAECLYPTWPSTGWTKIEGDCRACVATTTTTTTEAPRGACCLLCDYGEGCNEFGWCVDNITRESCLVTTSWQACELAGGSFFEACSKVFNENKTCAQVDCTATTTTGGPTTTTLCPGSCDYGCVNRPFGGWWAMQWVVVFNNCGNSGGTDCCCPDLGDGGSSDQCSSGQTQNLTNCREDCDDIPPTTTTTTTASPLSSACCWWFDPGRISACDETSESECEMLGDYPDDNVWHSWVDCDSVSCDDEGATTTTTTTTTTAGPTTTTTTTTTTTSPTTTTTGDPACGTAITCCPDGLLYPNICCGSDGSSPLGTCEYPTTTTTSTTTTTTTTTLPPIP